MSSFLIELEEKEIDNICLVLTHAKRNNQNKQAVKEFDELRNKLLPYASSTIPTAIKILEL